MSQKAKSKKIYTTLVGKKIGLLEIIQDLGSRKREKAKGSDHWWLARCCCGTLVELTTSGTQTWTRTTCLLVGRTKCRIVKPNDS